MREIPLSNPFHAPVYFLEETGSTMDDASDLWARGMPAGTVVWAGHQTQGRGRFADRAWMDIPGESLLFTHISDQKDPLLVTLGPISLLWAAALARLLRSKNLEAQIKWPNDILIGGKKVLGILVQGRNGAYLTGVGINRSQQQFPFDTRLPATSLALEGWAIDGSDLLVLALKALKEELDLLGPLPDRIEPLLANRFQNVSVQTWVDGRLCVIQGILEGIGPSGQALVRTSEGLKEVFSGE